jgi:hypothetical protein
MLCDISELFPLSLLNLLKIGFWAGTGLLQVCYKSFVVGQLYEYSVEIGHFRGVLQNGVIKEVKKQPYVIDSNNSYCLHDCLYLLSTLEPL